MVTNYPNRNAARRLLLRSAQPVNNASLVSIRIDGEVDDAMAEGVTRQLAASPKATTVSMIVNSGGGSLYAARRIFDAVRRHPAKRKLAHGLGQVASAAALIFAAADVRRLEPGTRVLLHCVAAEPTNRGRWTASQYERHAATLAALDADVAKTLADRCGAPLAVILAELGTEKDMPIGKALSIGFAHEVVGHSPPLAKAWPDTARTQMANTKRFTMGADGHRFSESYLNACRIGGK